jgi:hypothetical protein
MGYEWVSKPKHLISVMHKTFFLYLGCWGAMGVNAGGGFG